MRLAVFAFLVALSAVGRADEKPDTKVAAREHFERGRTLYDLGKFDAAAREFEAAYELRREPAFLFNIAQSYRFAGKYQQSLTAYRSFLRNVPDTPNRAKIEKSIAEIEHLLEQQKNVQQSPPTDLSPTGDGPHPAVETPSVVIVQAPPPKAEPVYKKWWLWTAVGGVVVVGVAVGLGVGLSQSGGTLRVLPPATGAP